MSEFQAIIFRVARNSPPPDDNMMLYLIIGGVVIVIIGCGDSLQEERVGNEKVRDLLSNQCLGQFLFTRRDKI